MQRLFAIARVAVALAGALSPGCSSGSADAPQRIPGTLQLTPPPASIEFGAALPFTASEPVTWSLEGGAEPGGSEILHEP